MVEKDIVRMVNANREQMEAELNKLREDVAYLTLENSRLSDELARRGSANVTISHTKA